MSPFRSLLLLAFSLIAGSVSGQKNPVSFDLYTLAQNHHLTQAGRDPEPFSEGGKKGIRFAEKESEGAVWIEGQTFGNGTIELDIKGREVLQQSFLGVAFHAVDENTADIVYFRPFNFQSTDTIRRIHAVQYVSAPDFGWQRLRQEQNGKYEKGIVPAPSGKEWFHARIVVHYPRVSVYVNGNAQASLTVDKLNTRKTGKIGLWIGPMSDAYFANLTIAEE
jgi:Domain of Unknown Function (DUF1080)